MTLTKHTIEVLKTMADSSPKFELCGVIDSEGNIHPIRNMSDTPERCFVFNKREYFSLLRKLNESGRTILCVYHTHPSGNASPSKEDMQFARTYKHPSIIVTRREVRVVE